VSPWTPVGDRPAVTSITVGDFTVDASELAFGVSTESGDIDGGTLPLPDPLVIVDDLYTCTEIYNACGWTTDFTGFPAGGYLDLNGSDKPDFFLLESTGQDS